MVARPRFKWMVNAMMGSDKLVVAVANDRRSKVALKWTLKNLVCSNDKITLLHISRPIRTISTPTGKEVPIEEVSQQIVAAYFRDVQSKNDELLLGYKRMCDTYKVTAECVIVENDSVQKGLLEYVSKYRITKLVLGASRLNAITWRLLSRGLSQRVLKEAPSFCNVLLISKHRPHLLKHAKSHSLYIEHESTSSESNMALATSSDHHSLGSSSQGKVYDTWDGSLQLGRFQNRHTFTSLNQFPKSSLTLPIPTDKNFTAANQLVFPSSEILALQDIGERDKENTIAAQSNFGDLHLYPNEEREEPHDDTESQISLCSLGSTSMDENVWNSSEVIVSQMVPTTSLDNNQGQGLHSVHHRMKTSEKFSAEMGSDSAKKVLNLISNSSQHEQNHRISPQGNGSSKALANEESCVFYESIPSVTTESMPRQLPPEIYEEKIEMLKEQLEKTLYLAKEAQQDADIQTILRIRAEREALWAVEKAEECAAKQAEEVKRREKALKDAEIARDQAIEEARKLYKVLGNVQLARHLAISEAQCRKLAEKRSLQEETEERKVTVEVLKLAQQTHREYDYEELKAATNGFSEELKLGEGGYGIVYKGKLHHMTVAIKVLKEDGYQGTREFQREVELLCRIHHPHMVLLLGCCPEKGCLVYEYMANGSLEDRLFQKGNTPPLHWSTRFRIIAEIANALHYLHSSRPDPVVHRDLKPGNILLDQNLVSKLSDVGLARFVPERFSVSSNSYHSDIVPVGTFAYIDPEYQRTGVFGPKSDIYALGIIMLQILTGRPAVGVYELVEEALNNERLHEVLDDSAGAWPHLESLELSSLALQCAEMKRICRPDLERDVLPTLDTLRAVAEDFTVHQSIPSTIPKEEEMAVPSMFLCPILQEIMDDPVTAADGYVYDYKAIKQWFEEHDTSPLTNLKLRHKILTPNHSLQRVIQEWCTQTGGS